jgi:hypothetical protein
MPSKGGILLFLHHAHTPDNSASGKVERQACPSSAAAPLISFRPCASADVPLASISVMAITSLKYLPQGCRLKQRLDLFLPTAQLKRNAERAAIRVSQIVSMQNHSASHAKQKKGCGT